MDEAPRAKLLLVWRTLLKSVLLALVWSAWSPWAGAVSESGPMHWSGDKQLWDRKGNIVRLEGHAALHQPGESLRGDTILIDTVARTVEARGHCVYVAADTVIYGEQMNFNLDTRTGSIVGGQVANESFTLRGERINKLGPGRFQTHRGVYTTCRDCPHAWTLYGEDVDMELEGYAYMSNVTGRVKDAPVFWVPYLILPLKTKRQTGLLFPRFGFTNEGFRFVVPFYWATGRSTDMTIGVGHFGGRGSRAEWEGRYKLAARSEGQANLYYLSDESFEQFLRTRNATAAKPTREIRHRWGLVAAQKQQLPFGIDEKFRLVEMSDNFYPTKVGDIPGSSEGYVASDLILSHATSRVSTFVAARRFRNLLHDDPIDFDPATVQVYPTAVLTTNDKLFFNAPVATGLALGVTNFTRTAPAFDAVTGDPALATFQGSQIDPIRKATRVSLTPTIYTAFRPWDRFSIVPSFEYRGYFYSFHNVIPNLTRGYLLYRTEFSTQLERIYETDDPEIPRVKHLIRPLLAHSIIPYVHEEKGHPFLDQINYARDNSFSGFNFDNNDIVPLDTSTDYNNYFVPIGHSLTYGLVTQLIRRKGPMKEDAAGYQRTVEVSAGQTFNFRELRNRPEDRRPFSRFFAGLGLGFDDWNASVSYTYVPYAPISAENDRHALSVSGSYVLARATRQRLFAFNRSLSASYSRNRVRSQSENVQGSLTYSVNDFLMPTGNISYDLLSKRILSTDLGLRFQHYSQCWKLDLKASRAVCPRQTPDDSGYCTNFGIDFALNLTGQGYGGVGEVASTVVSK